MDTDWTIIFAELLGTDLATIGRVLSWLLAIAIIRTGLAKAGVDRGIVAARSWLARRRIAAQATRTGVDDALVHVGSYVLEAAALVLAAGAAVVALVMWLTPHLRLGMALAQQHLEDTQTRRRPPKGSGGVLLGLLTWGLLLSGVLVTLMGCGPTQAQALHRGLNRATDYVDPQYELAVIGCDLAEGEVIAAHAPDEREAAAAALSRVRLECDRIFGAFEELRALQQVARATADAMEDGRATTQDVLRSLDEVTLAATASRDLVRAFRARHLSGGGL